jgi:hypothetical protein
LSLKVGGQIGHQGVILQPVAAPDRIIFHIVDNCLPKEICLEYIATPTRAFYESLKTRGYFSTTSLQNSNITFATITMSILPSKRTPPNTAGDVNSVQFAGAEKAAMCAII